VGCENSILYLALRRMIELVLLRARSSEYKELESVVLRHQLAVLRRQPPCDRAGWTRPRISEGAGAQFVGIDPGL
jgi:hypothetical protein